MTESWIKSSHGGQGIAEEYACLQPIEKQSWTVYYIISSKRSQAVILNCICGLCIIVLVKFLQNTWSKSKTKHIG